MQSAFLHTKRYLHSVPLNNITNFNDIVKNEYFRFEINLNSSNKSLNTITKQISFVKV